MPPDAQAWASQAEILALPAHLQRNALIFLRHISSLRPDVRYSNALSLAQQISAYTSAPPSSLHPERYIAAVLVVLRDREYRMLRHQQEQKEKVRSHAQTLSFDIPRYE